jgi:hypothetical protein
MKPHPIVVESTGVPGVALIAPTEPNFETYAAVVLGTQVLEDLRPILSTSMILENGSQKRIVYYGARFQYIGSEGYPVTNLIYIDMRTRGVAKPLSPGERTLVSFEPSLTYLIVQGGASSAKGRTEYRAWLENLAAVAARGRITASLDCVIFEDGQFAGADHANHFNVLKVREAAHAEFLQGFQERSLLGEDALKAWLGTLVSSPAVIRAGSSDKWRASELGRLARKCSFSLQQKGGLAFVKDEVLAEFRSSSRSVWR